MALFTHKEAEAGNQAPWAKRLQRGGDTNIKGLLRK